MPEAAHLGIARYRLAARIDPNKTAHRPRIVKRLFQCRGPQVERLLQKIDAQHPLHPDRRTAIVRLGIVRLDPARTSRPRRDALLPPKKQCRRVVFAFRSNPVSPALTASSTQPMPTNPARQIFIP